MKILVLGATGMLGSAVFKVLSEESMLEVWGSIRFGADRIYFPRHQSNLVSEVDLLNFDNLLHVLDQVRPEVVINAVGVVKQRADASNPLHILPINTLLPHRLAKLCSLMRARLIHISTDCVFNGRKGGYVESDISDAEDLYGKSKFMGELHGLSHALTLRTSIIGHEPKTSHSLVDWFLSQQGSVKGYSKAVFSGLPVVELASVIKDIVLRQPELCGLYHVAAAPISKLDLLRLIATEYRKDIEIIPDDSFVIDRSLKSLRFSEATGYVAPSWPELVRRMRDFQSFLLGTNHV